MSVRWRGDPSVATPWSFARDLGIWSSRRCSLPSLPSLIYKQTLNLRLCLLPISPPAMALSMLNFWTPKTNVTKLAEPLNAEPVDVVADKAENEAQDSVDAPGVSAPIGAEEEPPETDAAAAVETAPATSASTTEPKPAANKPEDAERPMSAPKRFSFRSAGLFHGQKNVVTRDQDASKHQKAEAAAKRASLSSMLPFPRSQVVDRRVQNDALAVQRLIVGSTAGSPPNAKARPVSRSQLTKIKSDLMQPKSANRLIAKLRELPMPDGPVADKKSDTAPTAKTCGPIHAVCLESTEAEVREKHFSKLGAESVASASLEALTSLFNELHIVDLISAPDFGLGQPGDGPGILAGAVPTAETVIEGVVKLTPQLMALGYATGKAALPDHTGVHPPTDRMSVITYWWGLELCLPPPSLVHLSNADSISHEVVNFLTALSLMNDGVREVLPFVRYISQFVDFEWNSIRAQDEGKGVVCAATWIMPAAMVPRPWDFSDPPANQKDASAAAEAPTSQGDVKNIVPVSTTPPPALVVTPPSVIKDNVAPKTTEK
ncbi:hypothetical protein DFH11DRAFT_1565361 [Phellopilus nigrolimitatus]|nr:hypothetical protein DFH11DRAFT_1565361 [Phellopilus nigrolimitatus]